ncbi:MAG: 2-C-methyl-D-erythritol 2,4-cyclodiphosphate synthase [Nitrospirales bacterium]|nr:MAG: 2-C-methyl-D-erythritol 2,4-cyclodiphosphate synthase [Nitrospirales bacterium]
MRIGQGYDIHPLKEGRRLILGGIEISHTHGLDGHSDADALVHAVCDALLGAMGEGDLGKRYPSSNPQFKDLSSVTMLQDIAEMLAQKGYSLINLDTVIMAQSPKLGPYLEQMAARMAEVLHVGQGQVNVKVKSGEGIGMIGRQEGIATQAVCLIDEVRTSSS